MLVEITDDQRERRDNNEITYEIFTGIKEFIKMRSANYAKDCDRYSSNGDQAVWVKAKLQNKESENTVMITVKPGRDDMEPWRLGQPCEFVRIEFTDIKKNPISRWKFKNKTPDTFNVFFVPVEKINAVLDDVYNEVAQVLTATDIDCEKYGESKFKDGSIKWWRSN